MKIERAIRPGINFSPNFQTEVNLIELEALL